MEMMLCLAMNDKITLEEFLNGIRYTPIHILHDEYDDVYTIEFRSRNKKEPSLEFYNHKDRFIYFEILDWTDYKEGTIIEDDRRIFVYKCDLDRSNMKDTQGKISKALNKLYNETNT